MGKWGRNFLSTKSCFPPIQLLVLEASSLRSSQNSTTASCLSPDWQGKKQQDSYLLRKKWGAGRGGETTEGAGLGLRPSPVHIWDPALVTNISLWFPAGTPIEYSNFLHTPGGRRVTMPTAYSSTPSTPLTLRGSDPCSQRACQPVGPSRSISNCTSTKSALIVLWPERTGFLCPLAFKYSAVAYCVSFLSNWNVSSLRLRTLF